MAEWPLVPTLLVDTRHEFGRLFSLYEWVTGTVVAVVFLLTLYVLVRYRRRREDEYPRGRDEAKVAESLYAVGLAAIAVVLVAATFRTEARVDPAPKAGVNVRVRAFQWQWRFDVGGRRVVGSDRKPATLVVPVGERIHFSIESRDVIHSFWIPDERFKRDAFPGGKNVFDLVFDREGTLLGRCAEFCGLRHSDMDFHVRVVSRAEFERWVSSA